AQRGLYGTTAATATGWRADRHAGHGAVVDRCRPYGRVELRASVVIALGERRATRETEAKFLVGIRRAQPDPRRAYSSPERSPVDMLLNDPVTMSVAAIAEERKRIWFIGPSQKVQIAYAR